MYFFQFENHFHFNIHKVSALFTDNNSQYNISYIIFSMNKKHYIQCYVFKKPSSLIIFLNIISGIAKTKKNLFVKKEEIAWIKPL
jgi:hypothetical protein